MGDNNDGEKQPLLANENTSYNGDVSGKLTIKHEICIVFYILLLGFIFTLSMY